MNGWSCNLEIMSAVVCSDNVYIGWGQRSAIRAGEPIRPNRGHDTKNLNLTGFVLLHPRNFVTLLVN